MSLFTLNKYPVLTSNRTILGTLTKKHNIISVTHLLTTHDESTGEFYQKYLFITDQGVLIHSTIQIFSDSGKVLSATVDTSLLSKLPNNIPILSVYCFLVDQQDEINNSIDLKLKIYFQVPKQKYDFVVVEARLDSFTDSFIGEGGNDNYYSGYADGIRYSSTPVLANLETSFETVSLPHILGDSDGSIKLYSDINFNNQLILASKSLFITDGTDKNTCVLISSNFERVLDACIVGKNSETSTVNSHSFIDPTEKSSNYHKIQNDGKILVLLVDGQLNDKANFTVSIKIFNFLTRKLDSEVLLDLPSGLSSNEITKAIISETGFLVLYFKNRNLVAFTHDFENFKNFEVVKTRLRNVDQILVNSISTVFILSDRRLGLEVFDICCRLLLSDLSMACQNINYDFDCNQSKILTTSKVLIKEFSSYSSNTSRLMTCLDLSMFNSDSSAGRPFKISPPNLPISYKKSKLQVTNIIKLSTADKAILNNWLFSLKSNSHFLLGLKKLSFKNLLDNNSLLDVLLKIIENSQDLLKKDDEHDESQSHSNSKNLKEFNDIIENINLQDFKNIKVDLLTVDDKRTRYIINKRCVGDSKFKYEKNIDVDRFINEGQGAGRMALRSQMMNVIGQVVNREFQ